MRRRDFLLRAAIALAAASLPRGARAQGAPTDSAGSPRDTSALPALRDSVTIPKPMPPPAVDLAFGGDTTLGYNLEAHFDQQLAAGVAKEQLWPLYFAGVKPVLDAADFALVNLECPFTTREEKLEKNFNFEARPELVEILKAGSVKAVTLANNHLKDYGEEGVMDTIATLDAAGIAHFGAGPDLAEARRPLILERNGVKIGLLGHYYQSEADMLEPKEVFATKHKAGVAGCYKKLDCIRRMVSEDLEHLLPRVDAAIPFFHWGTEGATEVQGYQIELAHLCVDLGCKAVLGAHPHRFQGVEVYRNSPIFYSLGNFVFGGNKDPKDKLSGVVKLHVTRAGVEGAEIVPIQITRWPEAPFQPFVLADDARAQALAHFAELSRAFEHTLPQLAAISAAPPAEAVSH